MRLHLLIIGMILCMFLTACAPGNHNEDFTEFQFNETQDTSDQGPFDGVVDEVDEGGSIPVPVETHTETPATPHESPPVQTPPTQPETPPTIDSIDETELFHCVADTDCILVQPDSCCACPIAVSRYYTGDFKTLPLGSTPSCSTSYLCGACAAPSSLIPKCVENKCQAAPNVTEETKPEEVKIISYPIPDLDPDGNFETMNIRPGCHQDYNSVYMRFSLNSPAETEFQVKEEGQNSYQSLWTVKNELFNPEINIVICKTCIFNQYPVLRTDKVYHLRLKTQTSEGTSYAGDYIIDTSAASEYMQKKC